MSGPSTFPAHPLVLSGHEPFARGSKRHCYVHPDDPDLCVKVAARVDADCLRQQRRDLEDYQRLRDRGAGVFERVPAIEGVVDTDLGRGLVMRLYRDRDGRISRNLSQVIREHGLTPSLIRAINGLKRWLRKERLLTMDTAPYNVVAVRLSGSAWKLVIIEGWENRKYRWLASLHPSVTDRLIARQLRKFDRRVSRAVEKSRDNS